MLNEIPHTSHKDGELYRRWFSDAGMDLIIWIGDEDAIVGFQLCYNKPLDEHALTWWHNRGFSHNRIDDGEHSPTSKKTPILVPDGIFDGDQLIRMFNNASTDIDPRVAAFVTETLSTFPEG